MNGPPIPTAPSPPDASPPRLATALLRRSLPASEVEFFLGDLEEGYDDRVARIGVRRARWWYWRESLRAALPSWPDPAPSRSPLPPRDGLMKSFLDDLRFAFRMIRRAPGVSVLTILTLALGIGATTAIFSVVYPALLQPPAYPRPDQLMMVWERDREGGPSNIGYLTFRDLERESRSLESAAAMSYWQPIISGARESERLNGQRVTQRFFHVLGVKPMLGRDFTVDEDHQNVNRVVMLAHGLWQRRFGGDSGIVGRAIAMNGVTYTVAGVLPRDFESLLAPGTEIFAPLGYEPSLPWACRSCRHLRMVARVKDGVSRSAAESELSTISGAIVRQFPSDYPSSGAVLQSIHQMTTESAKPALLALLGAVTFVLLIACVNAANLLLGRALRRESEFAVRTALGAGRGRLIRLVISESMVLAVVAGSLGSLAAWGTVQWLVHLGPQGIPRLEHVGVNATVLAFAFLSALVTGVAASVLPALTTMRASLQSVLRSGARGLTAASPHKVRSVLVITEVALAVTLLAGAALMFKSLGRLVAVNAGFDQRQRLTMEVQISGPKYQEDVAIRQFWNAALDAVRAVPGVETAAVTSLLPLGGNIDMYGIHLEDRPSANPELDPSALRYAISPDYLAAMGIPLLRGRGITRDDTEKTPFAVLINRTMADALFPGVDPIGRRLRTGGNDGPWRTVVGVVGNALHRGLDATGEFQTYVPLTQWWGETGLTMVVKTTGNPSAVTRGVRDAILSADRSAAIAKVATLEELLALSTSQRRFALVLFEAFALVALLLAAAGIYGVLAASVAERTREIGIRSALGAPRERILSLVVRQGLVLTVSGLVLGLAGALSLSRVIAKLLYQVQPGDPGAMLAVVVSLGVIAVLACALPAWRAVRVDPVTALREG